MPYGTQLYPGLPWAKLGAGVQTDFGTLTPPGGEVVAYVHSSGAAITSNQEIARRTLTTLNAALKLCRANKGDVVMVLPGHAENISTADQMSNLVAGTTIIGCGAGNDRPTFTWTASGSTFLFDVASTRLENCILNFDPGTGTTTVAAPITVSAAGCRISRCKIRCGTDANSKVTIGITTTTAGDDFEFIGNQMYGATAAECTAMLKFVGADRLIFLGNRVIGATSAVGAGVVLFSGTASTDITIDGGNFVQNNKAASTAAITGMAGLTGIADNTVLAVLGDPAANGLTIGHADGAWSTSAGSMHFGPNITAVNAVGERAAAIGTASA